MQLPSKDAEAMIYKVVEANSIEDIEKLINQMSCEGWSVLSLQVSEIANGTPRYTVLLSIDRLAR
jgi:hypothetical protein